MMKSNQGFEVVYNLYEFADGVYLPNAHIVTVDADGLLTYIQQKALDTTIGAFSMRMNVVRERLFAIHELLLPKTLEEKYTPAKKRPSRLKPCSPRKKPLYRSAIISTGCCTSGSSS